MFSSGFLDGVQLIPDSTELYKDETKGNIGIAIGGGAPMCNCIYVVQVFDHSPCSKDGKITVGDEIVAINGISVRGSEKSNVANLIRKSNSPVRLSFNRVKVNPEKGRTLDILLKKIKHWVVESMEPKTADALGLSRAVLCNDVLQKLLVRLDVNENFYKILHQKCLRLLKCYISCNITNNELCTLLAQVAVRELSTGSVNVFTKFADAQSALFREHSQFISMMEKLIDSINSYVRNAIPDVRLSLSKYMNAKFEYLSYCLKIKELEDEEVEMADYDEYPIRMETGNYEYRVMLKYRESSRAKFIDMRNHIQIKIQMLDEKQVHDLPQQLRNLLAAKKSIHERSRHILHEALAVEYKDAEIDKQSVDTEVRAIMRHLNIEEIEQPKLIVSLDGNNCDHKSLYMSIPSWRDTRTRATWPLDIEIPVAETEYKMIDNVVDGVKSIPEENLVDLNFADASALAEPLWPTTSNDCVNDDGDFLKSLIPAEWIKPDQQNSSSDFSAKEDLDIEPELLRQFRPAEADLLLVDL